VRFFIDEIGKILYSDEANGHAKAGNANEQAEAE
jgi:hypothetical protein